MDVIIIWQLSLIVFHHSIVFCYLFLFLVEIFLQMKLDIEVQYT